MNFRRSAIIASALLLLPLLSSCVSVLNPTGWAPIVFDGDTAYLTTSKGKLSAVVIQGDSATAKWTFPDKDRDEDDKFKTRAIYGSPVLDSDRVYVATFTGGVFALKKEDGRPIWPGPEGNASKLDGDIAGGLAQDEDNLYFGTTEGRLYAWKKADGSPAPGWEEPKDLGGGIWTTPLIKDGTIYVATMDGELHALATSDGSERWSPFKATGAIPEIAFLGEDLIFAGSINRHAYAIRISDGQVAADYRADDWVWTSPAVAEPNIYFGDFGGSIYGIDITSREPRELWAPASADGERVRSGPALIDNVLVVADRKPVVTFINATDGQVLNRVPLPDVGTIRANLVVKDGAAYFGTTDGRLFRAEPQQRRVIEIVLSGVKK